MLSSFAFCYMLRRGTPRFKIRITISYIPNPPTPTRQHGQHERGDLEPDIQGTVRTRNIFDELSWSCPSVTLDAEDRQNENKRC